MQFIRNRIVCRKGLYLRIGSKSFTKDCTKRYTNRWKRSANSETEESKRESLPQTRPPIHQIQPIQPIQQLQPYPELMQESGHQISQTPPQINPYLQTQESHLFNNFLQSGVDNPFGPDFTPHYTQSANELNSGFIL